MKKILLTGAFILLSQFIAGAKDSATYSYFCVKQIDGAEFALPADNLSITFADGTMTAVSSNGTSSFQLNKLESFFFTNETSAVKINAAESVSSVQVFTLDGKSCGQFDSVKAAAASLGKGIYVIKYSTGGSVKIELR